MSKLSDLTDTLYAAHDGLRAPNALVKTVQRDSNHQIISVRESPAYDDLITSGLQALRLVGQQSDLSAPGALDEAITALVAGVSFLEAAKAAYHGKPTPLLDDSIANFHDILAGAGYRLAN
jgi:hypothetical protein